MSLSFKRYSKANIKLYFHDLNQRVVILAIQTNLDFFKRNQELLQQAQQQNNNNNNGFTIQHQQDDNNNKHINNYTKTNTKK